MTTDDLIVRGVDRFRTILDGDGERADGIVVDGAARVTVANLTVREFAGSGIRFVDASRFSADRIDAIKNRTYGIHVSRSYEGVVRRSFGWGSGDAAFAVAECMGCGVLLEGLRAEASYLGYSGTNATGVTLRDSTWIRNGAGIVSSTAPAGEHGPGRGTLVVGNTVRFNNLELAPPSPAERSGIPVGTGIWLAGVANNVVRGNDVSDHDRYGVLVSEAAGVAPVNDTVSHNVVSRAGEYALAWDGTGADNCFDSNDFTGPTGPPEIESLYACAARPFAGVPYEPVREGVAEAIAESRESGTQEPREPQRPRCQKGRPGCHRHR